VRSATVDIGWEIKGTSAINAADTYLVRYKDGVREYTIPTTLAGCVADLGQGISFAEGELDIDGAVSDVTEVEFNPIDNTAILKAHTDPYVTAQFFKLDSSLLNGTEVLA